MPRQARIDIEGQLYHVMGRGIEQRDIFADQTDYGDFLQRLGEGLGKTGSQCFAFSLLPNHFHLLILRGHRPLAEFMRGLMTGYAVRFNRKYGRKGHLFQNRYKAILCDKDSYLLELIAYIHLNPLRAGLVRDLRELREYKWCGHGTIMEKGMHRFLAREDVLKQFGTRLKSARRKYGAFVAERAGELKRGKVSGVGGLLKGIEDDFFFSGREIRGKTEEASDERILGNGDFVRVILGKIGTHPRRKTKVEEIVKEVEKKLGIPIHEILGKSQARRVVKARALYCYLAKERCGLSGTQLMEELRLSSGAISYLAQKGRELNEESTG